MRIIKFGTLAFVAIMTIIISSCGSKSSKLKGTWKVAKVETKFDEKTMTPEMIKQVEEIQKETYFRILDDSSMVIISGNTPHDAHWQIDENNVISYSFKNSTSAPNKLGVYKDGLIKSESKTALGTITTYYEKE